MYPTWAAAAVAMTFVWLGMVLAISFLEAPLKFRAPGITIPLGLGIGRLVFRALNLVEAVLAVTVLVTVSAGDPSTAVVAPVVATVVLLLAQLLVVRPRLNRRSDRILAGENLPRSHEHFYYVGLEAAKAAALIALGAGLLSIG
jgi:hypothetical protein